MFHPPASVQIPLTLKTEYLAAFSYFEIRHTQTQQYLQRKIKEYIVPVINMK